MAAQELCMILATIVQRTSLTPAEGNRPEPDVGLTMAPKKGSVRLTVQRRAA
jgi:hypothetical protein